MVARGNWRLSLEEPAPPRTGGRRQGSRGFLEPPGNGRRHRGVRGVVAQQLLGGRKFTGRLLLCLLGGSVFGAPAPSPEQALRLQPVQKDVQIDRPAAAVRNGHGIQCVELVPLGRLFSSSFLIFSGTRLMSMNENVPPTVDGSGDPVMTVYPASQEMPKGLNPLSYFHSLRRHWLLILALGVICGTSLGILGWWLR